MRRKLPLFVILQSFLNQWIDKLLTSNGVLRVQGTSLAFPKITIMGNSATETQFTIGDQVIKIEKLTEPLVMVNEPNSPKFLTVSKSTSNGLVILSLLIQALKRSRCCSW